MIFYNSKIFFKYTYTYYNFTLIHYVVAIVVFLVYSTLRGVHITRKHNQRWPNTNIQKQTEQLLNVIFV